MMSVYGVKNEVIRKAMVKYTNLASFKLAVLYVNHGQVLLC